MFVDPPEMPPALNLLETDQGLSGFFGFQLAEAGGFILVLIFAAVMGFVLVKRLMRRVKSGI